MQKKNIFFFFFFLKISAQSAITYQRNGGRFGDDLIMYSRAKWLSLQYNIPLLYKPIHHGSDLVVSKKEMLYTKELEKKFDKIVSIKSGKDPKLTVDKNILYVVGWGLQVSIDWSNTSFLSVMRSMIAPLYTVNYIQKPDNVLSVAIHVRTGGGFHVDTDWMKRKLPLKFPPFNFYIKELQRIIALHKGKKIYVYIFTDHQQPLRLVHYFSRYVDTNNVQFDCRVEGNRHDLHVLDDFFNMMHFDVLIYPRSGLSMFAYRLGYQNIAISPSHVIFKSRKTWYVDQISFLKRMGDKYIKKEILDAYEQS